MSRKQSTPNLSNRIILLIFCCLVVSVTPVFAGIAGQTPSEAVGFTVADGYRLLVTANSTVTAYYYGGTSALPDAAFLYSGNPNPPASSAFICNDLGRSYVESCGGLVQGSAVSLGSFAAGSELVFEMRPIADPNHVNANSANWLYFNGTGATNGDGVIHSYIASYTADTSAPFIPSGVFIGFEDLWGGGDQDYNDLMFVLVAVPTPIETVPGDPLVAGTPELSTSTMFLAAGALLGLGTFVRRKTLFRA